MFYEKTINMKKEEYTSKKDILKLEYEKQLSALAKEYAFANNTHEVGDIIKDSVGSIKITRLQYTLGDSFLRSGFPEVIFTGVELKKDLTPTKKGEIRKIYQSSILTS